MVNWFYSFVPCLSACRKFTATNYTGWQRQRDREREMKEKVGAEKIRGQNWGISSLLFPFILNWKFVCLFVCLTVYFVLLHKFHILQCMHEYGCRCTCRAIINLNKIYFCISKQSPQSPTFKAKRAEARLVFNNMQFNKEKKSKGEGERERERPVCGLCV